MENKSQIQITALADDNTPVHLFIIDSLVLRGDTYLLASEDDPEADEDSQTIEAVLLKEVKGVKDSKDYITYVFVENDTEYDAVMGLFMQNDEYEIEL